MTFTCPKCKRDNLLADECAFAPNFSVRSCKSCYNLYRKETNKRNYVGNIKVQLWHRFYHLKTKYGLTKEQFENKLERQLNGCAICKRQFNEKLRIAVDHDHSTNLTRDLLCYRCNSILGHIEDNEELLLDILDYIKRHNSKVA